MSRDRSIVGRFLVALVWSAVVHVAAPGAAAGLLSPSDFAPLGVSLTESGSYSVDTSAGIMQLPDGGLITGVFYGGVAVFTFDSIDISGASFVAKGNGPFALLSRGGLTLDGVNLDVSANGQTPGPGGSGPEGYYDLGGPGGGGFGTPGAPGGPYTFTGVPNLIPPWGQYVAGSPGGPSYGGLSDPIAGGSGGGNFYYGGTQIGWGGAGGAPSKLAPRVR